ncbi:MAG: hypothetical protein QS748_13370 [Candidatus Endonucleobacter bathymodioli]|uniref:Uncharacterized protein n=1 Tax=Candidatus Endonucleibacter bathymodioli TaxID=539814 RepID=A0AA90P2W3_9GAMM|nr:hypothetical protein [Candidatus Endonucleobacter bathymodioli]
MKSLQPITNIHTVLDLTVTGKIRLKGQAQDPWKTSQNSSLDDKLHQSVREYPDAVAANLENGLSSFPRIELGDTQADW